VLYGAKILDIMCFMWLWLSGFSYVQPTFWCIMQLPTSGQIMLRGEYNLIYSLTIIIRLGVCRKFLSNAKDLWQDLHIGWNPHS